MVEITTVNNAITPDQLGKTLMHEHLQTSFPGWEFDALSPAWERRDKIPLCIDKIAQLQSAGFTSMIDPCPNDMGRDVVLMAEVSARTGFNIVCATGLYFEALGASAYWRGRQMLHADAAKYLADVYIKEITEGIEGTGVKAGVIKLASGGETLTDYDAMLIQAAGIASLATGKPITTHTDGALGDVQQARLAAMGIPAHRIVIGHSCGSDDFHYHMTIAKGGSYVGFDRFGLDMIMPDETRVASLAKVVRAGAGDRVVVSHDSVWCMLGNMMPADRAAELAAVHEPMRFTRVITPKLIEAGVLAEEIDRMLIDNPRRYFADEALPELG